MENENKLNYAMKYKKKTELQKKKEYELKKKRALIRQQTEADRERKRAERVKRRDNVIQEEDVDLGQFIERATTENRIFVNGENLHYIRDVILADYNGDFEMVGRITLGEVTHITAMRFRNIQDFETYINDIDEEYEGDDSIFVGDIYMLNNPEFRQINRAEFGRGTDFLKDIIEVKGINCYIPSSGYCFLKCINYLTGKDYKKEFLDFIRNEKRRTNVMTKARIQPFCKKYSINIGCYDNNSRKVLPLSVTERNKALYLYNHHFCLIWKTKELVLIKQ